MTSARVVRGRRSNRIFAEYIKSIWPFARGKSGAEAGADVENTPGIDFEVKATRGNPLLKALRQSEKRAKGALSIVVWRPDGYGEERVGEWVMAMRVDQGLELLRDAGYGSSGKVGFYGETSSIAIDVDDEDADELRFGFQ